MKLSARSAWLAVAVVAVLCSVLAYLQHQWIGEVARAERTRLREDLHFALVEISHTLSDRGGDFATVPPLAGYDLQIVTTGEQPRLLYSSNPAEKRIWERPDGSEPVFDGPPPRREDEGPPRGGRRGPPPDGDPPGGRRGRPPRNDDHAPWRILAQRQSGSLEALIAASEMRNIAVSGVILLLIIAIAAALVTLTRRAQTLADAQIGFVAGVSHELRTPLTVIRTAAFNLTNPKFRERPDQVERYGRLIEAESGKLQTLIDQVLRFASGRAGHAVRELKTTALGPLVEEEVQAFDSAGISLTVEPDLPSIPADAAALRHAVRNLLDNALRYGGGRDITVSVKATNVNRFPHITIEVSDRGPGIPPAEIPRVFDAFFRGSRALSEQIHGTGLGLNIVKTIAEAHGGEVAVKSELGQGSHFLIHLPCPANQTFESPEENANPVS